MAGEVLPTRIIPRDYCLFRVRHALAWHCSVGPGINSCLSAGVLLKLFQRDVCALYLDGEKGFTPVRWNV